MSIITPNFIRDIIVHDIKTGSVKDKIVTRFPPEPNGYLHIGHAKAMCIDFGLALEFNGRCHLRLDDTNPVKEDTKYIEAIKEDIHWLGFDWGNHLHFTSDYFQKLYEYAVMLIKAGKAFVCDLTPDEIRQYRGTLTSPGKESPFRNRTVEENLDLFGRMKNGEFDEGERVLRARIDMSSPNINMRDPTIYRIRKISHHRTGDKWCIYPMYDFAHCLSDAIEGITHSLCSLEFEDNRPLYNWFIENLPVRETPKQIEFARLEMTYTVLSKRKLKQLVDEGYVLGWDDPRIPTLRGLRRRGFTPSSIRTFCDGIGVAKSNSVVDIQYLEHCLRDELNKTAPRRMAVLKPLKVVITNYPAHKTEMIDAENNPEDTAAGVRQIPFSGEIYIERDDFLLDPPKKYYRLSPLGEVRLKNAYYITCNEVVKDDRSGDIIELHCTYDPDSRGGVTSDGRKVKGTIQWVSCRHAVSAEVRLYSHLFTQENPNDISADENWLGTINPSSLDIIKGCKIEPMLAEAKSGDRFQFLRNGYFCLDSDSSSDNLIFNRIVPLKDSWSKLQKSS